MQSNHRLGIVFMIVTSLIFGVQDGISKHLASNYNVFMVVMIRFWFLAAFILAVWVRRHGGLRTVARTSQLFLQIARGVLLALEIFVMVTAIVTIGLVESLAIFALHPLLTAVMAGPLLKESVGKNRMLAIGAGLLGVLVILQPGTGVFSSWSLMALGATAMFALYNLLTRHVARHDRAETSFFWMGVAGCAVATVIGIWNWEPMLQRDWAWMIGLCISGMVGHFTLIKCYEVSEANVVQPFAYLHLVFASAIGVILFNESLQINTILGSSIVVGAGLYALWKA